MLNDDSTHGQGKKISRICRLEFYEDDQIDIGKNKYWD